MAIEHRGGRTATLESEWEDLTVRHKNCRETIENSINCFPDEVVEAIYIVGAIGAGKSQLLLHGFEYSWTVSGKPAIYLDLSALVEELLQRAQHDGYDIIPQTKIHDYFEEMSIESIGNIQEKINNSGTLNSEDYLPDTRRRPDAKDYFEKIGVSQPQSIASKEDELIVLVDEMEDGYERLINNTEGTTGPLREIVDQIEKGNSRVYLIGAFGYASAHELGQAEARRVKNISLPICRPRQIRQILGESLEAEVENYAWWYSRGRPGWIQSALDTKANFTGEIDGSYDNLFDISAQEISRVEVLDREALKTHLKRISRESRDLMAYLLTNPRPYRLSELGNAKQYKALIKSEVSDYVLCDSELTLVEETYETIEDGLTRLEGYHSGVKNSMLSQFGERVLQGVANEDGEMVLGHIASPNVAQGEQALNLVLRPLVRRMHDIALEELANESPDTVEFLYYATQEFERGGAQDFYQDFKEFFDLFSSENDFTDDVYVSVDFETASTAFPSLITNPRLSFARRETDTDKQYQSLVQSLEKMKEGPNRLQEFGEVLQEDPR